MHIVDTKALIGKLEAFVDELATAPHFRARIHMAEHAYDILDEICGEIEKMVTSPSVKDPTEERQMREMPSAHREDARPIKPLRFKKMTLVQTARALLKDHGQLHGKEIERLAKEGGYRSKAEHFQSTLAVAFKRDGGFENLGENTWRVKPPSTEQRIPEVVPDSVNGAHMND